MDAHLSATMENTPEPEGNDIRRVPAGHLVRSGGVIVRAGTHRGEVALAAEEDLALGPVDVRLLGPTAVVACANGVADAIEELGWWRCRRGCLTQDERGRRVVGDESVSERSHRGPSDHRALHVGR